MRLLRFILYLTCAASFGWSILFFTGPTVLKWAISYYSDGQIIPSNVSVSPRFDVKIGRLNYDFEGSSSSLDLTGFSRAVKVSWSLDNDQFFLKLEAGPTFIENLGRADEIEVKVPELNLKETPIAIRARNVQSETFPTIREFTLSGILIAESSSIKDLSVEMFDLTEGIVNSGNLELIRLETKLLDLSESAVTPSGSWFTDIGSINSMRDVFREPVLISLREGILFDEKLSLKKLGIEVDFTSLELARARLNGYFSLKDIQLNSFFVGDLPNGMFDAEILLDVSKLIITSNGNFDFSSGENAELTGDAALTMSLGPEETSAACTIFDCDITQFSTEYKLYSEAERLSGVTSCSQTPCEAGNITHRFTTSNTQNFSTIWAKVISLTLLCSPTYTVFFSQVKNLVVDM